MIAAIHNAKANAIADDLGKTVPGVEDARGTIIDIILQILPTLLPMLLSCIPKPAKAEDVLAAVKGLDPDVSNRLVDRIRRNRIGRQVESELTALGDYELAGALGAPLRDSICRVLARTTTPEDCAAALSA